METAEDLIARIEASDACTKDVKKMITKFRRVTTARKEQSKREVNLRSALVRREDKIKKLEEKVDLMVEAGAEDPSPPSTRGSKMKTHEPPPGFQQVRLTMAARKLIQQVDRRCKNGGQKSNGVGYEDLPYTDPARANCNGGI